MAAGADSVMGSSSIGTITKGVLAFSARSRSAIMYREQGVPQTKLLGGSKIWLVCSRGV